MSSIAEAPRSLGRYALHAELASGGMASVHLGRLRGAVGFSRIVAIKRIHPHLAEDADFVAMFLDEARLASRVRHSNVVAPLDVVTDHGEIFLVMEYVEGESLAQLVKNAEAAGEGVPPAVALAVIGDVLHGLHAVHEAADEQGQPLHIVHRDCTPQNILLGTDGAARIADFGVAKAVGRLHTTRSGAAKGKLGYMSPEQLQGRPVSPRSDIYAVGVTLWELLAGRRMIDGDSEGELVMKAVAAEIPPLRALSPAVPDAVSDVVDRAIARDPGRRFASALEFAEALESAAPAANARQVAAWVNRLAAPALERRRGLVRALEGAAPPRPESSSSSPPPEETQGAVAADARAGAAPHARSRTVLLALGAALVLGGLALWGRRETRPPAAVVTAPPAAVVVAAAPSISAAPPLPPTPAAAPSPPRASVAPSPRPRGKPPKPDAGVSDDLLGRF